jgi:signal transduction histidine kinase
VLPSLDVATAAALCEQIIAASPDCVKVLDQAGRLTWMNAAGCQLMEVNDFACVRGVRWVDFWAGTARRAAEAALATAQTGGVGRFTGACPTLAGHLKWWNVIVIPMPAGSGPRRVVSISRDVSDLVAAAEARAALGSAERTARSDASEAEARRDDLLATLSHEMRAPLQTILSWAVLLQRPRHRNSVEAARRIEEAARDQLELCERMLESPEAPSTSSVALSPARVTLLPVTPVRTT